MLTQSKYIYIYNYIYVCIYRERLGNIYGVIYINAYRFKRRLSKLSPGKSIHFQGKSVENITFLRYKSGKIHNFWLNSWKIKL